MSHELDRICQVFEIERRKVEAELDQAIARVEMLRRMMENLSKRHLQAQADYLKRSKGDIFKKDKHENVL